MPHREGHEVATTELHLVSPRSGNDDEIWLVDLDHHLAFVLINAGEVSFESGKDRVLTYKRDKVSYTIYACLPIVDIAEKYFKRRN